MNKTKNIILAILVILITAIPLFIVQNGEFTGADGKAEELITAISSNYKPWIEPLWEPPSGEVESLLFTLQAAIGASFIGYFIGLAHGRKK
ncbi:MAG: cobalt ABC transporter substrate-binding protein CbiN [Candidatus Melainabacteria bacterium RIFOXYA2_FULL_32_9]|nr:MAG: cobalt ABC transporter substrate-binding protein CbiN [Candidatus Melainabacteria bacterium RIFOXYA2_FULL_32_9]